MTTYTDTEVAAVALAIANSDRAAGGDKPIQSLSQSMSPLIYRSNARAALSARDALFETVAERWEVRWPVRLDEPDGVYAVSRCTTGENAHAEANEMRDRALIGVRVVHVTTKRRKR